MNSMYRKGIYCLASCVLAYSSHASSAERTKPAAVPAPKPLRDGQHDFDWDIGTWKSHISRLQNPLTGSTTWAEMDGLTVVRKLWNGRANLAEVKADGPTGHTELLALRLYDPKAHEWSVNFATPKGGTLGIPLIGHFEGERGEFFDQEQFNGRTVMVRFIFVSISPTSAHSEQAFSADNGKTWETNFRTTYTRMTDSEAARLTTQHDSVNAASGRAPAERDGRLDFDFDFGTWKTHIARRQDPLTGSTKWNEYDGTWVVHKIWNGRANLVELEADGPAGHLEGLGLRLYNPESRQWSLNWANSTQGTMGIPTIGEFKDGRGEFFDQETCNGRAILIRNVWSDITPTSCKFEQAFSTDGGKTWEPNWISTDTRTSPPSSD